MIRMICEIGGWLYRSEIRKILILNGHMLNLGPIYTGRENLSSGKTTKLAGNNTVTIGQLVEDCLVLLLIYANIAETACVLVDMKQAIDEDDYETFFEYQMDQYSKYGIVGIGAAKATPELGEKLFGMVVEELVSWIQKDLNENNKSSKKSE